MSLYVKHQKHAPPHDVFYISNKRDFIIFQLLTLAVDSTESRQTVTSVRDPEVGADSHVLTWVRVTQVHLCEESQIERHYIRTCSIQSFS